MKCVNETVERFTERNKIERYQIDKLMLLNGHSLKQVIQLKMQKLQSNVTYGSRPIFLMKMDMMQRQLLK